MPSLSEARDVASIAQGIAAVVGAVLALFWWLQREEGRARANIQHHVVDRRLDDDWTWVRVAVEIENSGSMPLEVRSGFVRLERILPLAARVRESLASGRRFIPADGSASGWTRLAEKRMPDVRPIAPEETDHLEFQFVVSACTRTIRIYSYLEEVEGAGEGWAFSSVRDLEDFEEDCDEV